MNSSSSFPLAILGLALGLVTPALSAQATTILDLQPQATTIAGTLNGKPIKLTNLNPSIGRLYLLDLGDDDKTGPLNLEAPEGIKLSLEPDTGKLLINEAGATRSCEVDGFRQAMGGGPYVAVCGGAVWLRRVTHGARTVTEAATDLLRQTGSAGEFLINFYKNNFNDTREKADYAQASGNAPDADSAPPQAHLSKNFANRSIGLGGLAITVDGAVDNHLKLGNWYPAHGLPGVFATVITPDAAAGVYTDTGGSSVDLVAFDMSRFQMRYAVGTDHPALTWSDRAPLPHPNGGPDGFGDSAPLVRTGVVPPFDRQALVAVISGGFKREHGAFKTGAVIGLHYGFAEDGVVLSRLHPGIMTVFAGLDGQPQMKMWTEEDAAHPPADLLFARQTGYALLDKGEIGEHVDDPNGNWSGSNEGHLLTMRAGACLLPAPSGKNFLVYGVFTGATPPHMANVFKALGCSSAVHLDANSPTLTYAAIFRPTKDGVIGEHLQKDMALADPKDRFKYADVPDNRDFFYLLRRGNS